MSELNCEVCANQLFDVVAFNADGEQIAVVTEGALFSGALACARGFNAHSRGDVAVVLPATDSQGDHESELIELHESDFCASRADETETTACLWDWLQEGVDVESVDMDELEGECHRLIRLTLAESGQHLPPSYEYDDDGLLLSARLTICEQLAIWQKLRRQF